MSLLRPRFDGEVSALLRDYASSWATDLALLDDDLRGSIAHARMLGHVGVLAPSEAHDLVQQLELLRVQWRTGAWQPDSTQEDIHMAVETELVRRLGETGKKLHTARSRNDQIATATRLWLKRHLQAIDEALLELIETLLQRIERNGQLLMPGYTHLQRGQPILLGHVLAAYASALLRDHARVGQALLRTDASPLGAGALAGTSYPIDRHYAAQVLGFDEVLDNALDATASRDYQAEALAACAILAVQLSRMAEELVLWSSREFGFVRLADAHTTGSSIMPQKRNPDAAELIRGKSAGTIGRLAAHLSLVKALPYGYNRDLQEDRVQLMDAVRTTLASVQLMTEQWAALTVDLTRFADELVGDYSLATELADGLVGFGLPFREAHERVARLVSWCEQHRKRLNEAPAGIIESLHSEMLAHYAELIDPVRAIARRTSHGGTAWPEVQRQVQRLRFACHQARRARNDAL